MILFVCDANITVSSGRKYGGTLARTCISTPNFFAIGLDFSYRITGFFFRLSSTAMMPCTERSSAAASHEFGDVPYSGRVAVGVWFSENSDGSIGA